MKKVSIIIVNFNSSIFLKNCIESIYKYTNKELFEVIIVNNSPNDNLKFIKEFFNDIKIIENESNLGFSKANNIGIKESIGEYILFLNPDTEIISDVL
ncbi:MAG: glycosyltransferase, partial [Cyanobacteriota bacterium]